MSDARIRKEIQKKMNDNYLNGITVVKIRNMLCTWAGVEMDDKNTELKAQQVKNFFVQLTGLGGETKTKLLNMVNFFFPSKYVASDKLNGQISPFKLKEDYDFLITIFNASPAARAPFQQVFKNQVLAFFKQIQATFLNFTPIASAEAQLPVFANATIFKNFAEFATAFTGEPQKDKPEFELLNQCVQENPNLFTTLVDQIQKFAAHLPLQSTFRYFHTGLHSDPEEANTIDGFILPGDGPVPTNGQIFAAQREYIIRLIIGNHFLGSTHGLSYPFPMNNHIYIPKPIRPSDEIKQKFDNTDDACHFYQLTLPDTVNAIHFPVLYGIVRGRFEPLIDQNGKTVTLTFHPPLFALPSNNALSLYERHRPACNGISLAHDLGGGQTQRGNEAGILLPAPMIDTMLTMWNNIFKNHFLQDSIALVQDNEYGQVKGPLYQGICEELKQSMAYKSLSPDYASRITAATNLAELMKVVQPIKTDFVLDSTNTDNIKPRIFRLPTAANTRLFSDISNETLAVLQKNLAEIIDKCKQNCNTLLNQPQVLKK